jgi:hypothetical protein
VKGSLSKDEHNIRSQYDKVNRESVFSQVTMAYARYGDGTASVYYRQNKLAPVTLQLPKHLRKGGGELEKRGWSLFGVRFTTLLAGGVAGRVPSNVGLVIICILLGRLFGRFRLSTVQYRRCRCSAGA